MRKKYKLVKQNLRYHYCLGDDGKRQYKYWHKYQYVHYFVIGKENIYYFHEEIWCLECKKIMRQRIRTEAPNRFDLDYEYGIYA